jgi:hypothetical protein
MATEPTDPKTGLIAKLGLLSIATLILVHLGLNAYYDRMAKAEERRKVATPDALNSARTDEKARLASGSLPIDKAMQQLVDKGRMNAGAAISPMVSKDVAPLQGWTKLPGEVPPAMTAAPAPTTEPATSALAGQADGGAMSGQAGDAGATGAKPDGGPMKGPAPKPGHK